MMMFVTTLAVGAVAGFMMEKQFGAGLVRWSRMQRMRARVLRRQGVSPWRAWFDEDSAAATRTRCHALLAYPLKFHTCEG